ncbi:TetR/AcrR family transcriptional regulator [Streptomyces cylindrosporus]|uniref:TetR/AcrR family transcriptional regulator n=1 Tax=Streptomyces cylindrosporus TaxID=2927583 RepID=A0ABS9Y0C2_9ACTN|nr:TetR/AcrR family transcriptional regulator [Streptomyces cylindrosporus]MCI3270680.1 TetR/AcrR family transcriptional regulator [Streptomyces cylindrosporus]
MQLTDPPSHTPRRSIARSNRARILATAREELRDNPDATLDHIAQAAGVVRRTVYGHFPGRHELITALTQEAGQALEQAFTEARAPGADPVEAMARMVLAAWAVGDEYRMLISLGRRHLGEDALRLALAPAREEATSILKRGQDEGVFDDRVPAPVLALGLEALMLTLAEAHATSVWTDPTGEAATAAFLVAAGVSPDMATLRVRGVVHESAERRRS